jgi:hypothetical protein
VFFSSLTLASFAFWPAAKAFGQTNTAFGIGALASPSSANLYDVATGFDALNSPTSGSDNTANGAEALYSNTTGRENTANGFQALYSNTDGVDKTANGASALFGNSNGHDNTANGLNALYRNSTGSSNIAVGAGAGQNLTTGDNNIDIGNEGLAAEANTIRIGNAIHTATYIAGIYDVTVESGSPAVVINSDGYTQRIKYATHP